MRLAPIIALICLCVACGDDFVPGQPAPDMPDPADMSAAPDQPGSQDMPDSGSPGGCAIPQEAFPEDVSTPTTVVGDGTPASCTSQRFVEAVARGGVITFDCGPAPHTIVLDQTAKVFNDKGPKIVIDGGGLITLSGDNKRRILYQNTCDQAQVWTTPRCQDQDHPQLSLQNLRFIDGDATGQLEEGGGGGAVFVRGGRLKIINSTFERNRCDMTGQDLGGGAVRVLSQYQGLPVYVIDSTFGGSDANGNVCSNGGALSSIGVSMTVINSTLTHNRAVGEGANPARSGTPGGGSGGAIYNDGDTFELNICGSELTDNHAREGGGAIFFVSNDRSGAMRIEGSTLERNVSEGFETDGLPGIFVLARQPPTVIDSTLR